MVESVDTTAIFVHSHADPISHGASLRHASDLAHSRRSARQLAATSLALTRPPVGYQPRRSTRTEIRDRVFQYERSVRRKRVIGR